MGTAAPTGIVFNDTSGFQIPIGNTMVPSTFIAVTEDGFIAAWGPGVPAAMPTLVPGTNNAVIIIDNSAAKAVYKGVAIMTDPNNGPLLYAANFNSGRIEVYNANFKAVDLGANAFTDPAVPSGLSPFNIARFGNDLFVTWAQPDNARHDNVAGAGLGAVSVFNSAGVRTRTFALGALLNAPWGMTLAPNNVGKFSNAIFIGNFGDGRINVYTQSGLLISQLPTSNGTPVTIDGLWGIRFGNGAAAGPTTTLFFTAGIMEEQHGLFGALQFQSQ
jgi:uncharacterized protein (TIGR03118 family)